MSDGITRDMAKYWWLRCVACSEASMTTQMRGFGLEEPVYEEALHAFSGGFMHLGYACGLLTGAAVAAGFLARERFDDDATRSAATLYATIQLAKAHPELTGSVNCREITELDFTKFGERLRYLREGKARMCGRLHLNWSPQAHELIDETMTEFEEHAPARACANCAVKTMERMAVLEGVEVDDAVLVAGFAGGVGLLGNVCGALAAGAYALSLSRQPKHERKKRDSRMRGSIHELTGASFRGPAARLRLDFIERYDSGLCNQIIEQEFQDIEDHSAFIEGGGCEDVIGFVADWVETHAETKQRKVKF